MLTILYQDDHVVAIDKPSGLLVHRTTLAPDRDTCMRRLRDQLGRRVYPAHRLDRGTSGVLLFALDPASAARLAASFAGRSVSKEYLAVVRGWAPEEVTVDYPLAEEKGGTPADAVTRVERLATYELQVPVGRYQTARYSLVQAEPLTGRMHQIRRHMAHLRHPVIGDTVHGEGRHNRLFREMFGTGRMLLHASSITLPLGPEAEMVTITAPLPADFESVMKRIENYECRMQK